MKPAQTIGGAARATGAALARHGGPMLRDLIGIAGIGLAGYGTWLIYQPAGFIVAGAAMFGMSIVGTWRSLRGGAA
jgi:hypothetical protein